MPPTPARDSSARARPDRASHVKLLGSRSLHCLQQLRVEHKLQNRPAAGLVREFGVDGFVLPEPNALGASTRRSRSGLPNHWPLRSAGWPIIAAAAGRIRGGKIDCRASARDLRALWRVRCEHGNRISGDYTYRCKIGTAGLLSDRRRAAPQLQPALTQPLAAGTSR